jgi:hypothetical protein
MHVLIQKEETLLNIAKSLPEIIHFLLIEAPF